MKRAKSSENFTDTAVKRQIISNDPESDQNQNLSVDVQASFSDQSHLEVPLQPLEDGKIHPRVLKSTSSDDLEYIRLLRLNGLHENENISTAVVENKIKFKLNLKPIKCLGSGGFGSVWSAKDMPEEGSTHYALKVIQPKYNDERFINKVFSRRFYREAFFLSELNNHPNIVRYYSSMLTLNPCVGFLKMELLNGGNLLDVVRIEPLPVPILARIIDQIGSALNYMHERNFAHHDVKLENIGIIIPEINSFENEHRLFRATFKLIDFGLASFYSGEYPFEEFKKSGTRLYLCPEKEVIDILYDAYLADAYAFGLCIMFASIGYQRSYEQIRFFKQNIPNIDDEYPFQMIQPNGSMTINMKAVASFLYQNYSKEIGVLFFDEILGNDLFKIISSLLNEEEKRISIAQAMSFSQKMMHQAEYRFLQTHLIKKDGEQQSEHTNE